MPRAERPGAPCWSTGGGRGGGPLRQTRGEPAFSALARDQRTGWGLIVARGPGKPGQVKPGEPP